MRPFTVAWISDFPVEWLSFAPEAVRSWPKRHPLSWMQVLLSEFESNSEIELHILVLRKKIPQNVLFKYKNVSFHILKTPARLRAPSFFWLDTLLIKKALKKIQPDIVHAWGTERGAALVASRLKIPYVVTIQGLLSWYQELVHLNAHERFEAVIERFCLSRAPLVTTESNFAVNYLRKKFPQLRIHQAEHAPNWIFHHVQRQPQTRPLRFVFVGTFNHRKGGDLLLAALDRLKDELSFETIIAGVADKNFLARIQKVSSAKLWSCLNFKHNLLPAEIAREISQATLMIFPTRADTSPNAVKEAAVAGLPVVASNIGGIPDYIFPGKNGILFPSEDLDACINSIRQACQHPLFGQGKVDPDTLTKVRVYLSPKIMGQKFLEAYNSIRKQNR